MQVDTRLQQSELVERLKEKPTEHELSIPCHNSKYVMAVAVKLLKFLGQIRNLFAGMQHQPNTNTLLEMFCLNFCCFFPPPSLVNACCSTSLRLLFSWPVGTFAQMRLFLQFSWCGTSNLEDVREMCIHSKHPGCFHWLSYVSLYLSIISNSFRIFYQAWFILTIYRECKWLLLAHFKVETGALAGFTRSIFVRTELSVNKLAKFSLIVSRAAVCKASQIKALSGLPINLIKSFNRPITKTCSMKSSKYWSALVKAA